MRKNILLISIFMLLSIFIAGCSDSGGSSGGSSGGIIGGDGVGSFLDKVPKAKENTGSATDINNKETFYGEYQVLYYYHRNNDTIYSNDCNLIPLPDGYKCYPNVNIDNGTVAIKKLTTGGKQMFLSTKSSQEQTTADSEVEINGIVGVTDVLTPSPQFILKAIYDECPPFSSHETCDNYAKSSVDGNDWSVESVDISMYDKDKLQLKYKKDGIDVMLLLSKISNN